MSKHNDKNFTEFKNLKSQIATKPADLHLLKQELKANYYQNALSSLADLKRHMQQDFVKKFFCKATMRFFKTEKIAFSKRDLTVTCFNERRASVYEVVFTDGGLSLRYKYTY